MLKLVLLVISLASASSGSGVTFIPATDGTMTTPRMQQIIGKIVDEPVRRNGRQLCDHVTFQLKSRYGSSWDCFFRSPGSIYPSDHGQEIGAKFFLDGIEYKITRSGLSEPCSALKNRVKELENELVSLKRLLAQKQKEHGDYVKKMADTKAVIEKMLAGEVTHETSTKSRGQKGKRSKERRQTRPLVLVLVECGK